VKNKWLDEKYEKDKAAFKSARYKYTHDDSEAKNYRVITLINILAKMYS